jgi:hypothetical protein
MAKTASRHNKLHNAKSQKSALLVSKFGAYAAMHLLFKC